MIVLLTLIDSSIISHAGFCGQGRFSNSCLIYLLQRHYRVLLSHSRESPRYISPSLSYNIYCYYHPAVSTVLIALYFLLHLSVIPKLIYLI